MALDSTTVLDASTTLDANGIAVALIETLTDAFSSNTGWTTYGTVVFDGQLKLTAGSGSGIYRTGAAGGEVYDLTGSSCMVEFVTAAGTENLFYVSDGTATQFLGFRYNGTQLQATYQLPGGSETGLGSAVTYNSTNHRWLRFRNASGTTYWETCATSTGTWATLYSTASLPTPAIPLTALQPSFFASGSAGTAVYDNLNLPGGGGGSPPSNTSVPTTNGTAASGALLTGFLGTWTNSPTSYAYSFRQARNHWNVQNGYTGGASPDGTDFVIPGTSGTTSNSAFTPTYTMTPSDASRGVYLHVIATNASGSAAADSVAKIFYASAPPWGTSGNPWKTPLPSGVAIDSAGTTALRAQLDAWYTAGKTWFAQGDAYGEDYSSYLHIVDSSMPRTPVVFTQYSLDVTQPKYPQVQNSTDQHEHNAWTFGVKNGGVPTPPGGFIVPNGGDQHCAVYCTDTHEYWEMWVLSRGPYGAGDTSVHADFRGHWTCGTGGYIRDVTADVGYWRDIVDVDGNKQFAAWGAMANSLPYFQATVMVGELASSSALPRAVGVLTPGTNGTHRYPAQRADGSGASIPAGGIWQLDPAFNVDGLATTGDSVADTVRSKLLKAAQTYGFIQVDTTAGQGLSLRFEALGGTYPDFPGQVLWNIFGTTTSLDAMIKSVPTSSWRMIAPSYRPTGSPASPKTELLTETFDTLDTATKWGVYGATLPSVSGGRLNIPVIVGGAGIYPYEGYVRDLTGSFTMIQLVQAAGTECSFYVHPNDSTEGAAFTYSSTDNTLKARLYDNAGAADGAFSSVTYNSTNHKWLRFREASGSIVWETSPGGSGIPSTWTWTTLRTAAPSWDMGLCNTALYATGSGGTAIFDNLNAAGPITKTGVALRSMVALGGKSTPGGSRFRWLGDQFDTRVVVAPHSTRAVFSKRSTRGGAAQ